MKYPYQRFLRFLVSRKIDLNRTLERYGLPRAGDLWAAECRSDLRNTAPYAIVQYLNTADTELVLREGVLEWARDEGILPLWKMQSEFNGAKGSPELDVPFRLFVNPMSRAILGMLLLSRASDKDLVDIVRDQFDTVIDPGSLALYKSIFWDVSLVSRSSWGGIVGAFLTQEEKNYVSFGLSSPTADEVRDMIGMDCVGMDHKTILNQIVTKSYLQWKKAMDEPAQGTQEAIKWAEMTLRAITTAKATGGILPVDDAPKTGTARFKALFSVQPEKTKHPSLADLAGEVGRKEEKPIPEKAPEKDAGGK